MNSQSSNWPAPPSLNEILNWPETREFAKDLCRGVLGMRHLQARSYFESRFDEKYRRKRTANVLHRLRQDGMLAAEKRVVAATGFVGETPLCVHGLGPANELFPSKFPPQTVDNRDQLRESLEAVIKERAAFAPDDSSVQDAWFFQPTDKLRQRFDCALVPGLRKTELFDVPVGLPRRTFVSFYGQSTDNMATIFALVRNFLTSTDRSGSLDPENILDSWRIYEVDHCGRGLHYAVIDVGGHGCGLLFLCEATTPLLSALLASPLSNPLNNFGCTCAVIF